MSIPTETFFRFKGGIDQSDLAQKNLDPDESSVRAQTRYHNVEELKGFLAKNRKNSNTKPKHKLVKLTI